jgi:hypothetical protein
MKQSEMIKAALSIYRPDQVEGDSLRILVPGDEFLQDTVDRFLETRTGAHQAPVACFYETMSSNVGAIVGVAPKKVGHGAQQIRASSGAYYKSRSSLLMRPLDASTPRTRSRSIRLSGLIST